MTHPVKLSTAIAYLHLCTFLSANPLHPAHTHTHTHTHVVQSDTEAGNHIIMLEVDTINIKKWKYSCYIHGPFHLEIIVCKMHYTCYSCDIDFGGLDSVWICISISSQFIETIYCTQRDHSLTVPRQGIVEANKQVQGTVVAQSSKEGAVTGTLIQRRTQQ